MEDFHAKCSEKGKVVGERKYHPNSVKDVKRKLSCMNKKIHDFQHQRKLLYKNSVKVKKMIHNQVNQIVKCLRARERTLWSEVDEVYISQDANISDELFRLQSVYAHCHALFNHIEDLKGKTDVFATIYSVLSEVNFGEKPDAKLLEFVSDFEAMKAKANSYGYLEGDSIKKSDYILVAEEKGNDLSAENYKQFHNKEKVHENISSNCDIATNENFIEKCPTAKETECEDFQIIDLVESMCCHDLDGDFVMADEESLNSTQQIEKEFSGSSIYGNDSKCVPKVYNSSEHSEACESHKDFDPEEEWKQILEMNKKIANFHEIASKLSGEKPIHKKIEKTIYNPTDVQISTDVLYDKNCTQNRFLLLKEADNWLHNPIKDALEKDLIFEKNNIEIDSNPPAKLIQKAFKSYFIKNDVQNWLLTR